MNILYLGDIFGTQAIQKLLKYLPRIKNRYKIDLTIAQGENVSGRKGMVLKDYQLLKKAGIDVFAMGNHVWAKDEIFSFIDHCDIVRPLNVACDYPGVGSRVFKIKGKKIRVTQFMGVAFNELRAPWKEKQASNFFDAFEQIENNHDLHIVDFHGETTSEKNVFGLFLDGKIDLFVGTHTHVQTNDARILPKGTAYITDVGMVGPMNAAIGASYETVYRKMRYNDKIKFETAKTDILLNAIIVSINRTGQKKIFALNKILK